MIPSGGQQDKRACRNALRRRMAGFTLVELLVVVAVSAVLVTTAVPIYKQTIASYRIDAEVNTLVGDLQYARSEAIKQGTTVVMCISTSFTSCASSGNDWSVGHVVGVNAPGSGGTSGISLGTPLRAVRSFGSTDTAAATFVTSGASVGAIQFNRDGFAGTPASGAWNGFSSLAQNVFIKVFPAAGGAGLGKCVAVSIVGQVQVVPYLGKDSTGDTCQ